MVGVPPRTVAPFAETTVPTAGSCESVVSLWHLPSGEGDRLHEPPPRPGSVRPDEDSRGYIAEHRDPVPLDNAGPVVIGGIRSAPVPAVLTEFTEDNCFDWAGGGDASWRRPRTSLRISLSTQLKATVPSSARLQLSAPPRATGSSAPSASIFFAGPPTTASPALAMLAVFGAAGRVACKLCTPNGGMSDASYSVDLHVTNPEARLSDLLRGRDEQFPLEAGRPLTAGGGEDRGGDRGGERKRPSNRAGGGSATANGSTTDPRSGLCDTPLLLRYFALVPPRVMSLSLTLKEDGNHPDIISSLFNASAIELTIANPPASGGHTTSNRRARSWCRRHVIGGRLGGATCCRRSGGWTSLSAAELEEPNSSNAAESHTCVDGAIVSPAASAIMISKPDCDIASSIVASQMPCCAIMLRKPTTVSLTPCTLR